MDHNQRDRSYTDKVESSMNSIGKQLKHSPNFGDWDSAGYEPKSLAGQPELKTEPYTVELACPEPSQQMLLPSPHPKTSTCCQALPEPSAPCTTQLYSGMKGKASSTDLKALPAPFPLDSVIHKSSVDDFFCNDCQVNCSSPLTLSQHLNGKKHKAKLNWRREKWNSYDKKKGCPRCDVCQICCTDNISLEMHGQGKKHMSKLQQIENEEVGARKPIRCELCLVICMNEVAFQQHLKGRKHAYRFQLSCRGLN